MVDAVNKPAKAEKYEGPGRFVSSMGSIVTWGNLGAATSALIGGAISVAGKVPRIGAFIGSIGVLASYGISAVKGWNKASRAEANFYDMKSQRDGLEIKSAVLENQLEQTQAERKQFSAGMSPRAAGGHADGVLADRAAAAGAEAAR